MCDQWNYPIPITDINLLWEIEHMIRIVEKGKQMLFFKNNFNEYKYLFNE